jgi:hypothetical protein
VGGGGIVQAAAIQSQLLELVLTNKCRNCHKSQSLEQPVVQVLQLVLVLVLNYRTSTGTSTETKCSTSTGARTGTN